jgi:hypothetical protein
VKSGSKPDTANNLSSFYVGLFRDTKIVPMLLFGSGFEYFQCGMSYTNNTARVLHTLSVPLDLKVKLAPAFGARYHWGLLEVRNGKHSQYLQVGAGISF